MRQKAKGTDRVILYLKEFNQQVECKKFKMGGKFKFAGWLVWIQFLHIIVPQ